MVARRSTVVRSTTIGELHDREAPMRWITAVTAAVMAFLAIAPAAPAARDYLSSRDKLEFGTRLVGTENFKGVSVKNRTSSDIDVYVTSSLWDDFGFGLMPGSTCPALGPDTLRAFRSCRAVVRFSPTAYFAGLEQPGLLTVTATHPRTGAVLDVEDVRVTGLGVLPWRPPILDVSPSRVRFGRQPFGSFTKKTVTLTNTSSETVHVSIDSWAPDDISPGQPESTCPLSHTLNVLAPGQRCTHVVGYHPSEAFQEIQTAQLNIRVFSDSGEVVETRQVTITGQGV
jgi:hypothetical protein